MRIILILSALCIIVLFYAASPGRGVEPGAADTLLKAETDGKLIPLVSLDHPAVDVPMAYRIQKAYAEQKLKNETLSGFKAGLTSPAGQRRFGLSAPVA